MLGNVRRLCLLGLLTIAGCGESDDATGEAPGVSKEMPGCDLRPIDSKGTLPACAAGKASAAGPGVPYGQPAVEPLEPPSGADVEAAAEEEALSRARNRPGLDPVDLGFGRPPARPLKISPPRGAK